MRICTAISQAGISHLAYNGGLDYMHVGSTIHRVIDYFTVSVHRPNSMEFATAAKLPAVDAVQGDCL